MKKIHLICTSHIDPIWQWTWDEGISSAIATFQSAVNLLDEYDYVFCHNESMVYEAIENCAPDLFATIQRLVKEGRWKIAGGWYLQPDCNMPSGETLIRQISVGKKYFKEKFGVEPNIAYNFDSFGHNIGLVQILAKNGYKGYMICRPRKDSQFNYPGRFFKWVSPDGSSVIVTNSESYGTLLGKAVEKISWEVQGESVQMLGSDGAAKTRDVNDVDYSLWGVGNHGGGPSRKDLSDIENLKIDGYEFKHSSPEDLFADNITVSGEVKASLVTVMPGCYSSMAKIKQAYRKTENLFYATEKMLASAKLSGEVIDDSAMRDVEKKILLATFHDVLPGTCVEEGEREGLCSLASAEKTLRDFRTTAFLKMATSDLKANGGEFPVFVFNYAPYEVVTPIEVEFMLENQNWDSKIRYVPHVYYKGEEIACQTIKEESTLNLDWRKKITFEGKLAPMGMTRFTIRVSADERKPIPIAKACDFDKEIPAYKPIFECFDDTADPWGMSDKELKEMGSNPAPLRKMTGAEIKDFCALSEEIAPERIIEDGEILRCYEGGYTYGNSNVIAKCKVYKNQPYVDYKITVEFNEKNKLLRVKFPIPKDFGECVTVGDGALCWEQKPNAENVFQKWYGVKNSNGKIFAIINDGVYSGKVEGGYVYLTLLRGAGYCFHPIGNLQLYPEDRYLPRIDCGRYTYNLRLFIGDESAVCRMAEEFNQPPYAVNVFPTGTRERTFKNVKLVGDVVLTNLHSAKNGYVARVYNPSGTAKSFALTVGEIVASGDINPFEFISVVFDKNEFEIKRNETPV